MINRGQLARAWHIAAKDVRAYYLKPPAVSWGMLFPAAMVLAVYLGDPGQVHGALPGLIGLTMLFGATSIEAVVIAFEKRIGALERLLTAPVSPEALVLGKTLSGALFGLASGGLVWLAGSVSWGLPLRAAPGVALALALGAITFSLLGVAISLLMREVFDAMTLANYFRFPMVFLCGVFVPLTGLPLLLQVIAHLLPLTYTVDALRHLLLAGVDAAHPLGLDLAVSAVLAVVLWAFCLALMRHRLEDIF